jgi:hypothetical protein
MGVASTSDQDTRSSFSNYGNAIVWVAAPGEAIVTTYPFSTYSAGWGTSFSAPFVSGGAALLRNLQASLNESQAAGAVGHAVALDPSLQLGKGRLDLMLALGSLAATSGTPDYSVFATPLSTTITAGNSANYTVTAAPAHGFNQTVTWTCTGAPTAASCTVSPQTVTLDGSNAATATVTLTTMARTFSPPMFLPRHAPPTQRWWVLVAACFAWFAVAAMLWSLGRPSLRRPGFAAAAGLVVVSLCTYSCGGYGTTPGSAMLSSLALNPTSVTGRSPSTGTVTLDAAAPSGGAAVTLSSSNTAAATVPSSVTVAAGATSATFQVTTMAVTSSTPVTISGYYAGVTKTGALTVTPAGTPAGTYTLTITGTSGNLSHATTVTVTVN